jgi:hypothetical protein
MTFIAPIFTKTMTAQRQHAKILYKEFYPLRSLGKDSEITSQRILTL